jgi:hypothetical protein
VNGGSKGADKNIRVMVMIMVNGGGDSRGADGEW